MNLDLLSLDQFVDFVFDRPITEKHWYFSNKLFHITDYRACLSSKTVRNLVNLFKKPEFLLENYSSEQLVQGFGLILLWLHETHCHGILWEKSFPLDLRRELIESMYDFFSKLFTVNSLEHTCFMWWDSIGYGYYMNKGKAKDEDEAEIHQIMFETLKRILEIDSRICQESALHGLGHLMHAETELTIQDFLVRHQPDDRLREYALKCIAGTMG